MRPLIRFSLSDIWLYLLWTIAFSFPFGRRLTSVLMISWVVISLILIVQQKRKWPFLSYQKSDSTYLLTLLPVAYYVWGLIGMTYTNDLESGINELTKRISFVIIPLIFLIFRKDLTRSKADFILKGFLFGMFACAIFSLLLGFRNSIHIIGGRLTFRTAVNDISYARGDSFFEQGTQGGNYFMSDYISPFLPTIIYYGMYLCFAVFVALYLRKFSTSPWIYFFVSVIIFVVLFLCDSRGPLISFILSVLLGGFIFIKRRYAGFLYPLLLGGILFTLWLSPRGSLLLKNFKEINSTLNYNSTESTALRLIVWKASFEVAKENWILGVGIGDAEKAIQEKTKPMNLMAHEHKLNAHNQYFQTLITSGVIGIALLFIILGLPLYMSFKTKDYLGVFFIMTLGFNMLFESIFQTFQGIQFFLFFYCLQSIKLNEN